MTLVYLVASKEAVLFFVFFSGNSESICQVFLSKYHTKTFDWTADLFAFVVKRGRLRQQQAEGQLHDTASAPIALIVRSTYGARPAS